jgi:hypothetical protein
MQSKRNKLPWAVYDDWYGHGAQLGRIVEVVDADGDTVIHWLGFERTGLSHKGQMAIAKQVVDAVNSGSFVVKSDVEEGKDSAGEKGLDCPNCHFHIGMTLLAKALFGNRKHGGRKPILRRCPKGCGEKLGAREMRLHVPTCDGGVKIKLPTHEPHKLPKKGSGSVQVKEKLRVTEGKHPLKSAGQKKK